MIRNVAASVRARLATRAKEAGRPLQEILQYYGLERFLYRLFRSPHSDRFLLKGALALRVWDALASRPTRDIDLLGYVDNDIAVLAKVVQDVCAVEVCEDGMHYDASTIVARRIKEGADYEGVRIKLTAFLANVRIPIQLDVGFGDVVHPVARRSDYPTLLDLPAPTLRTYPRETVVAEKLQAMVYLGKLNSRMKDFFDLWMLARQFSFAGPDLRAAIEKTFRNRNTEIDVAPMALTSTFTTAPATQKQWAAFVKRSMLHTAPPALEDLRLPLRAFLLPVVEAISQGGEFTAEWSPSGPWSERSLPGRN